MISWDVIFFPQLVEITYLKEQSIYWQVFIFIEM